MYIQEAFLRRRQRMTTLYYRYAPPVFEADGSDLTADKGVKPPFKDAPSWMCSVYYYWWEFLRTHKQYMHVAKNRPEDGDQVMRDFGDPDAFGGFEGWWRRVGRELFCEPFERSIRWADTPDALPRSEGCVYLSVPYRCDVDHALTQLRDILKPKMPAIKADLGRGDARYPVFTKPVLSALHRRLLVLRAREQENYSPSSIGLMLKIGPQDDSAASKLARDEKVSRDLREARYLRDYAAQGFFPVKSEQAFLERT